MASTEWYPPGAAAALARVRTTIERERRFGRVTCVLEPYHLDATLAPPEAANAIVTRLGFAPLRDPWRAIDRAHAIAILERILQRDLVDGGEIMPPARALALAVRFVTMFGPTAHLFTNGTFRGAPERSGGRGLEMDTGTPLTDASLDTGVVCFDTQHIGIVWVVDHD